MLEFPFGAPPAPGTLTPVAPGVGWLRMPLPFELNHINLWVVDDATQHDNGCALVDCGIDSEATRQCWETLFGSALAGRTVSRVIGTHCHPDHIGLAHWLCAQHQAPFVITQGEYALGRILSLSLSLPGADAAAALAHFGRHGLTAPDAVEKIAARGNFFSRMVPAMPLSFQRIREGDRIALGSTEWRVITGFGHSPEHAALYNADGNVLISGDMLLPTISTNVSVFALEPDGNPLQLFLQSLDRFLELPEDVLVLPSHGLPFRGAHKRVAQLRQHHEQRLAEVRGWCATPHCAAEIVPLMFKRKLDIHQTTFAIGEAIAHLHALWHAGVLRREIDSDGVYRYSVK